MLATITPNRLALMAAVVLLSLSATSFFGGLQLNAHGFLAAGAACGFAAFLLPVAWK